MTDHCPACRVARELTEHRDKTAVEWTQRRAVLNFARTVSERACPDYHPRHPAGDDHREAANAAGSEEP